jgi:hypothetical protein
VRGVTTEKKFFPVGFQPSFPFSDNTIIHQFQDKRINKFAANNEWKVPTVVLPYQESETQIPNKIPKW